MTASSFAMTSTLTQGEQSVAAKVKRTNTAESFPLCVGGGGGGGEEKKKRKRRGFFKSGTETEWETESTSKCALSLNDLSTPMKK